MGFFNQPDRQFDKDTGLLKGWERVEIKDGVRYLPKGGAFGSDQELNEEEYQELVKKKTSKVKITDIPQSDDDPKGTRLVKQTTGAFQNLAYENPELTGLLAGTAKFMAGIGADLKQSATNPNEKDLGKRLLGSFLITEDKIIEQSAKGAEMWATGGDIFNPWTKEKIGSLPDLDIDPTLAGVVGGAAASIVTGVGVDKGLNQLTKLKNLTPPSGGSLSYATVGVGDSRGLLNDSVNAVKSGKPLMISMDQPFTRIKPGMTPSKAIEAAGSTKWYKQLNKKYQYLSPEKIVSDPDLLRRMRTQETLLQSTTKKIDDFKAQRSALLKEHPNAKQRPKNISRQLENLDDNIGKYSKEITEIAGDNPLMTDIGSTRIYGKDSVRSFLKKNFPEFDNNLNRWHHEFGSADIGKSHLTDLTQDPWIKINLYAHMKKHKIFSSGTVDNLILMKEGPHNAWHAFAKSKGLEPEYFIKSMNRWKNSDLTFYQYIEDISKEVIAGKADINELFTIVEAFGKSQDHFAKKLLTEYGGTRFRDVKGIKEKLGGTKINPSKLEKAAIKANE